MELQEKLQQLVRGHPVFHWLASVDESHYVTFMDELKKTSKGGKLPDKVVLYLNNVGGDLSIAWAFYDFFRISGIHLVTIASGNIESAAVTLFLAGKERYASQFSSFLVHDPELTAHSALTKRNVEQTRDHVLSMHERHVEIISRETGLDKERVDELCLDASPITVESAKELGIVHEIF